jgi:hypothetical protein
MDEYLVGRALEIYQ